MQGKKHDIATKTQALALYAYSGNTHEVARQLSLPQKTVYQWIHSAEGTEELTRLQAEKKAQFIAAADRIIDKANALIERHLGTAMTHAEALDKMMRDVEADQTISQTERKAAIAAIKQAQMQSARDLAIVMGTVYDKRALSRGDSTSNVAVSVEALLDKVTGTEF